MRKPPWRWVFAAVVCVAWARAETLDEAVERLAKAGKSVRDVTMKGTFGIDMTLPTYSKAPPVERKIKGTVETSALWQGDTLLVRESTSITHAVPLGGKGPSVQAVNLVVVDGQNTWAEVRSPLLSKQILVGKGPIGSFLPRSGIPFGDVGELGSLTLRGDLKAALARDPQRRVALAGTGTVAGRATTTLQFTREPTVTKGPFESGVSYHTPVFLEFDNDTGLCVAGRVLSHTGQTIGSMITTSLQVNTGLDKRLFRYTPPEGVEVSELSTWEPYGPKGPTAVRFDIGVLKDKLRVNK